MHRGRTAATALRWCFVVLVCTLCMPVQPLDQFHEVWAVMDHKSKLVDIEAGVGVGLTAGSDRVTLKLMLSRDLNSRHPPAPPESKTPN